MLGSFIGDARPEHRRDSAPSFHLLDFENRLQLALANAFGAGQTGSHFHTILNAGGQVGWDQEDEFAGFIALGARDPGFRLVGGVDEENAFIGLIRIEFQAIAGDRADISRRHGLVFRPGGVVDEVEQNRDRFGRQRFSGSAMRRTSSSISLPAVVWMASR